MSAVLTDPKDYYLQLLDGVEQEATAAPIPWLQQLQSRAARQFRDRPFPGRRDEAWRHTSLARPLGSRFRPSEPVTTLVPEDLEPVLLPGLDSWRLVLVNGWVDPWLSQLDGLPKGVSCGGLQSLLDSDPALPEPYLGSIVGEGDIFERLNLAALQDGVVLQLSAGTVLEKPVEIVNLVVGADQRPLVQPRILVALEAGARAELIERHLALGPSSGYFTNAVVEVALAEDAYLQHYRLQEDSAGACHLSTQGVRQGPGSEYRGLLLSLGGSWSRTQVNVELAGEGARCELDGLYLVDQEQLHDVHLAVRHRVPDCTSREDFRGILGGRGRAVFDGFIEVVRDAQGSDARLSNNNLLLSRDAEVDTKPSLEIHADDVQCSHGTTVGQIEPDLLFYLRSRGIPEAEARRMICLGFAEDLLTACPSQPVHEHLHRVLSERLLGIGADPA